MSRRKPTSQLTIPSLNHVVYMGSEFSIWGRVLQEACQTNIVKHTDTFSELGKSLFIFIYQEQISGPI